MIRSAGTKKKRRTILVKAGEKSLCGCFTENELKILIIAQGGLAFDRKA